MHNKFVILDRLEVWTGSMNYTINGAYHNDNNLVRVRSNRLADNYTAEFEEMFVDDLPPGQCVFAVRSFDQDRGPQASGQS